jgi:hypothetical protein
MSYQACEDSRAMITKILRLFAVTANCIQPLHRSRSRIRVVCWQTEFRF